MAGASYKSVVEMFWSRVGSTPSAKAILFRDGNDWDHITWQEVGIRVKNIACGLRAIGLENEQRCAILASTRPEWVLADMAILMAAGATTTIYPSNTASECAYIITDSGTRVVFAENLEQVAKLKEVRDELPQLDKVIDISNESETSDWIIPLEQLETKGQQWDEENEGQIESIGDSVGPDDLATLIYTSGTTGKPKGVMLTHDCWVYEGEAIDDLDAILPSDSQYLFLPLSHSFAKVLEIAFIRLGIPTVLDSDLDNLVANMAEVRPSYMGAVPRIFEKVYNKVVAKAQAAGGMKYRIFTWSLAVGRQVSTLRQRGEEPRGALTLKYALADKLVFSKIKELFGGRLRFFVSGGAPLSREIAEFFHSAGILILEGYGLTETSAATFVNRPTKFKFGTVGPPLVDTEVKIAEDGEILIKGRGVMKGYYNRPEDNAEAFTSDGWFCTGDIGKVDKDGFLSITDRKKDIIVTAGGKNISPQNIENLLKARCLHISQIVVHGDKRNYCSALITINEESVGKWAAENGIAYQDYASLSERPEVRALLQDSVDKVNSELASYETIKKFAILDHDFTVESGELTPKMSVKRRVVEKRHRALLDKFYQGTITTL